MPYVFPNKEQHIKNNLSFFAPGDALNVYFGHISDEDPVFSISDVPAEDRVFWRYAKMHLNRRVAFSRADVVRSRIEYVAAHARVPVHYKTTGSASGKNLVKPAVVVMCDPSVADRPVAIAHPFMYLGKSFCKGDSSQATWVTACNDALHETMHLFGAGHESESCMLLSSFAPNWGAFLDSQKVAMEATQKFGYTGANHAYDAWYMLKHQVCEAPYDADFSTQFDPHSCTGVGVPALYSFFTPTHQSVQKPPPNKHSRLMFLSRQDKRWLREMYDPGRKTRMNKISHGPDEPGTPGYFRPREPNEVVPPQIRTRLRENSYFMRMVLNDGPSRLRSWILDGNLQTTQHTGPFPLQPYNPHVIPAPSYTIPPPLADDSSDSEQHISGDEQPSPALIPIAPRPPKKCCILL